MVRKFKTHLIDRLVNESMPNDLVAILTWKAKECWDGRRCAEGKILTYRDLTYRDNEQTAKDSGVAKAGLCSTCGLPVSNFKKGSFFRRQSKVAFQYPRTLVT